MKKIIINILSLLKTVPFLLSLNILLAGICVLHVIDLNKYRYHVEPNSQRVYFFGDKMFVSSIKGSESYIYTSLYEEELYPVIISRSAYWSEQVLPILLECDLLRSDSLNSYPYGALLIGNYDFDPHIEIATYSAIQFSFNLKTIEIDSNGEFRKETCLFTRVVVVFLCFANNIITFLLCLLIIVIEIILLFKQITRWLKRYGILILLVFVPHWIVSVSLISLLIVYGEAYKLPFFIYIFVFIFYFLNFPLFFLRELMDHIFFEMIGGDLGLITISGILWGIIVSFCAHMIEKRKQKLIEQKVSEK